ncbi:hypothetical protein GCM10025783_27490 [Amnibacterium soli]|uniref:Polysaccharide chain length determinant N-terminal domain-containing protein n=1 Tax=Amnibacterium soli TaxID=1282736 RepID=A0ABP8ZCM7_9MICO
MPVHTAPIDTAPVTYLGLVSRHRRSFALCVLLFTAAGLGAGALSPVTYTAQGQMIAGATSVNAAAVPSFTQAGQALAQTYSRVFSGDEVQKKLVAGGFDRAEDTATASPLASSSVILIESTAPSREAALRAADTGIDALSSTVSTLLDNSTSIVKSGDSLRAAYVEQAQAQAAIDQLDKNDEPRTSRDYETATARLGAAQATVSAARQLLSDQVGNSVQSNGVRRLTSAHVTSSTSTQRFQLWGALGLVAGIVVWSVAAFLRSRPRRARSAR